MTSRRCDTDPHARRSHMPPLRKMRSRTAQSCATGPVTAAEPAARRGLLSMELVLTLPILGIVLFGLLEFSLLFYARSAVVSASRAGARVAMLEGAGYEQVETAVCTALSPRLQQGLKIHYLPADGNNGYVLVGLSVPMASAAPDLLWPVGYSLRGRELYAETTMLQE